MDLIVLNYIFTKSKGKLEFGHHVEVTRRIQGSRAFPTPTTCSSWGGEVLRTKKRSRTYPHPRLT